MTAGHPLPHAQQLRNRRGSPGVIVVEATGIRDVPSGPLLRIGHDRFLPENIRLYHLASTQHGGYSPVGAVPPAASAATPNAHCSSTSRCSSPT